MADMHLIDMMLSFKCLFPKTKQFCLKTRFMHFNLYLPTSHIICHVLHPPSKGQQLSGLVSMFPWSVPSSHCWISESHVPESQCYQQSLSSAAPGSRWPSSQAPSMTSTVLFLARHLRHFCLLPDVWHLPN